MGGCIAGGEETNPMFADDLAVFVCLAGQCKNEIGLSNLLGQYRRHQLHRNVLR